MRKRMDPQEGERERGRERERERERGGGGREGKCGLPPSPS